MSRNLHFLLLEALSADGARHKQYYLEEILIMLVGLYRYRELKEQYDWESGIVP